MKPTAWRFVLLAFCAIAALGSVMTIVSIVGLNGPPWTGHIGTIESASSRPFFLNVLAVGRGGAGDQAGLRAGDLIDIRANSLLERFWLTQRAFNGKPIALAVHRGSDQKAVVLVPQAIRLSESQELLPVPFLALWLSLFAALIAWRRSAVPQMRLLSLTLSLFALETLTGGPEWAAPWSSVYLVALACHSVAMPLALALWTAFAGGFARPLSRLRRSAQWLSYAAAAITIAFGIPAIVGVTTLWLDPVGYFYAPAWRIPISAAAVMALVCSLLAIAVSRGVERQRAAWALVPLAILNCFWIGEWDLFLLQASFSGASAVYSIGNFVNFAAPVALTYGALSRRTIDIGFVLNRAVVFAVVSTIVLGSFILIELLASTWLAGMTRATSAAVGLGVALVLGLSLRYVHKYVDHFVDRVFFRKRHEAEAALRRFAHEAAYITDGAILLDRALREVREHTAAQDASILVLDDAGEYVSADQTNGVRTVLRENDPGIVALRAWHKPLDLPEVAHSELRGEFAFPMVSRGTLFGVLVCGPKRDGEAYAPDESEALLALAHGVGAALDTLSAGSHAANARLQATLELVLEELRALPSRLNGSPPSSPVVRSGDAPGCATRSTTSPDQ